MLPSSIGIYPSIHLHHSNSQFCAATVPPFSETWIHKFPQQIIFQISIMASFVYLILYLYFHSCVTTGRPLMVQDKENFVQPQVPSEEGLATRSNSNPNEIIPLSNQRSSVAKETETIKSSYTLKRLLHQATASEIHKTEQSTSESAPNKVEETINSKESEPVADVAVMDYAQPHRKPPIHNKGT